MQKTAVLCCGVVALAVGSATKPVGAFDHPATTKPRVRVETSLGEFTIELNAEVAPVTVSNFLRYVKDGFYNGTLFHRVTKDVIQGGGYTQDMQLKSDGLHEPIAQESRRGLYNQQYTVSLFRNPLLPKSGRTQFFVNIKNNPQLDLLRDRTGYTVFGKVVDGTETIDKIAKSKLTTHPDYARGRSKVIPDPPVIIKRMVQLDPLDEKKTQSFVEIYRRRAEDPLGYRIEQYEKQTDAKPQTTKSGLTYLSLKEGTGAFPTDEDTIEFNFKGMLVDGFVFDTSLKRWNGPGKVEVSTLLPGLREGVSMMREGGRALLVLPPDLAFGEEGMPNKVPPNATTLYEIELLSATREEQK